MMIRIVLILLLLCSPAFAHDASRPELNNWFDHLSSGKGQRFLGITRSGWMYSPMIRAAEVFSVSCSSVSRERLRKD